MTPEEIKNQVDGEEVPIQVTEETEVGSLADVKEKRTLIPPTKNVKVRIDKAEELLQGNPKGSFKQLKITTPLVEGIEVVGEDGEPKVKYKNAPIFTTICFYADATIYTKDYFKDKQHLVQYTMLLKALDRDVSNPEETKVNDQLIQDISKRLVIADIVQEKATPYTDKEGVKQPGQPKNYLKNFKAVSETDGV